LSIKIIKGRAQWSKAAAKWSSLAERDGRPRVATTPGAR
jgi:hypothetical protein